MFDDAALALCGVRASAVLPAFSFYDDAALARLQLRAFQDHLGDKARGVEAERLKLAEAAAGSGGLAGECRASIVPCC